MPIHDWSCVDHDAGTYVPAPLETTYEATWAKCPEALKDDVEKAGSERIS